MAVQNQKVYTIDATGKSLGRLSAEVAPLLRGKNEAAFLPYRLPGVKVEVKNISAMRFTKKKKGEIWQYHHTGYHGGLKSLTFGQAFQKDPKRLFIQAVKGMLPRNKLRAKMLKNLAVS